MKTSVIEVSDMLSVLSALGVEKRIGEVPGVESVTVNYAAGNATVRFDETRLKVADIKSDVRQNGYESAAPAAASSGSGHEGHTATMLPAPAPLAPAKPGLDTGAVSATAPGDRPKDKSAPNADAPAKLEATSKPAQATAPATAVTSVDGEKVKPEPKKS